MGENHLKTEWKHFGVLSGQVPTHIFQSRGRKETDLSPTLNGGSNPDSVSYILYPLSNFLDLLDEKTSLFAHRVVGKMSRDNHSFLLNKSSIQIKVLFGESYEHK